MSSQASRPIRVLFVEDAIDQALLVRTFLQPATAYDITHSQDGDHAATLLREQPWDILITDLNIPGTDGFELCRIARKVNPILPVLAITGYTGAHFQEEAYRAGATDLLQKPLVREEFVAKVAGLVGTVSGARRTSVLAIGGLVGDVEMGCGGSLLKQVASGAQVVIVPLARDTSDASGTALAAARRAGERLGARVVLDEEALDSASRRGQLIENLVRDLRPRIVYLPAMDDEHPARREAFRVAKAAIADVPIQLGYQTATSSRDFRPSRFEEVEDELMDKMEALTAYQEAGAKRPDLSPRMARAYARYWGRLQDFGEVEPFEVIRGG